MKKKINALSNATQFIGLLPGPKTFPKYFVANTDETGSKNKATSEAICPSPASCLLSRMQMNSKKPPPTK
jgi:hypothetical protein